MRLSPPQDHEVYPSLPLSCIHEQPHLTTTLQSKPISIAIVRSRVALLLPTLRNATNECGGGPRRPALAGSKTGGQARQRRSIISPLPSPPSSRLQASKHPAASTSVQASLPRIQAAVYTNFVPLKGPPSRVRSSSSSSSPSRTSLARRRLVDVPQSQILPSRINCALWLDRLGCSFYAD